MKISGEIILAMSAVYQKQVHNFKKCRATIAQVISHHFKLIKVHLQYSKYKERRCKKIRRQRENSVKLYNISEIDYNTLSKKWICLHKDIYI